MDVLEVFFQVLAVLLAVGVVILLFIVGFFAACAAAFWAVVNIIGRLLK